MRLRNDPTHFPRAPGKRTSGQMARFTVFHFANFTGAVDPWKLVAIRVAAMLV